MLFIHNTIEAPGESEQGWGFGGSSTFESDRMLSAFHESSNRFKMQLSRIFCSYQTLAKIQHVNPTSYPNPRALYPKPNPDLFEQSKDKIKFELFIMKSLNACTSKSSNSYQFVKNPTADCPMVVVQTITETKDCNKPTCQTSDKYTGPNPLPKPPNESYTPQNIMLTIGISLVIYGIAEGIKWFNKKTAEREEERRN